MKKILTPLILTIVSLCIGQTATAQLEPVPGNKSDLCQKWQIDIDAFLSDLPEEMKAMIEMVPPEQKEQMMEGMRQQMGQVTVQFFEDGTMKATGGEDGAKSGTWSFSSDKKSITTIAGDDLKETVLEILVISSNELKLREKGKPTDPSIPFKPFEG